MNNLARWGARLAASLFITLAMSAMAFRGAQIDGVFWFISTLLTFMALTIHAAAEREKNT